MQSIDTLKADREVLSRQIAAIDAALEALGSTLNGSTHTTRRRWTKAQREAIAAKKRKWWKDQRAKAAAKAAKKAGGQQ